MKGSFFLLNEYRIPICYLNKNVPCNAEEKIELKNVCYSLYFTVRHSFLKPDDTFFSLTIKSPFKAIGKYWSVSDQVTPSLPYFKTRDICQRLPHLTSIPTPY